MIAKYCSYLHFISIFLAFSANAASFDCHKATTEVEKAICSNPDLSELDDRMSKVFAKILEVNSDPTSIKEEQRNWIRNTRNTSSGNPQVLKQTYEKRINELADINPKEKREFLSCRYSENGKFSEKVDASILITQGRARVRWEAWQYASGYYGCALDTSDPEWKMDGDGGKFRFTNSQDPACTFVVKVTKEKAYFLSPIVNSILAKSIHACGCGQNGAYWDLTLDRSSKKCSGFDR